MSHALIWTFEAAAFLFSIAAIAGTIRAQWPSIVEVINDQYGQD